MALGSVQAATYTWDAGGANDLWSTPQNWVGDTVPTFAAEDTFDLTHAITAAGVSTMDSSATLGIVNILGSTNGAFTWTLNRSGSEVLTIDNGASAGQINTLNTPATGSSPSPFNIISVPVETTGNLNISNQARNKTLQFTENISSSATSGTQTLTLIGNSGFGGTIQIDGGISDGTSGGQVAVVVNSPNASVVFNTQDIANTYTGGTILQAGNAFVRNNGFGPDGSSLTIQGNIQLSNAFNFTPTTQNLGTIDIESDFRMDGNNFGNFSVTGSTAVNLGNATRTIDGGVGASNVGNAFLHFAGSGQTINDGTLRITSTKASATAPVNLRFATAVTFQNADLEIGADATTSFDVDNAFGTDPANLPNVTVETDGALNLSNNAFSTFANSHNLTIASLAGAGNVVNSADSGTATLTINGSTSTTFSGVIQNGGFNDQTGGIVALTKAGSGTQTLSGANTYTGATMVNAGTLLINGSTGDSAVTVAAGATLGGSGTIGGTVNVSGNLNPGTSPGDLTFEDSLTLTSTATTNLEITGIGVGEFDRLIGDGANTFTFDGTLALDNTGYSATLGDTITVFSNWDGFAGSFDAITGTDLGGGLSWDTSNLGVDGSLAVIPEPSTAFLGLLGLCLLAALRRRK